MSSNPVAGTVASLMPRPKEKLTELVAFTSVAAFDQCPRSESEAAAKSVSPQELERLSVAEALFLRNCAAS